MRKKGVILKNRKMVVQDGKIAKVAENITAR